MEWPLFHHPEPEHLGPEQPDPSCSCGSTNISLPLAKVLSLQTSIETPFLAF